MLELLAVMALVGLLSVGGVEGYQVAIQRHQTNTILEGAAQRAIAVSQQVALGTDPEKVSLGEFPTDAGRNASFPTNPKKLDDEFFSIPVAGLDEAACEQLKTMGGNGLRRVDCKKDNGSVTAELIYHKDLSDTAGNVNSVSTGGSSGSGNSTTRAYDNNKAGCVSADYQYCDSNNTCITKGETCPEPAVNCNQYPGAVVENGVISGRIYMGKASDNAHLCYCPTNYTYNNSMECVLACSGRGTLSVDESNHPSCSCQDGYAGNSCERLDPCTGFTPTLCTTACTDNNGIAQYTYAEEGSSCGTGTEDYEKAKFACDGEGTCNQCPEIAYALDFYTQQPYSDSKTSVKGCYCNIRIWNEYWKACVHG